MQNASTTDDHYRIKMATAIANASRCKLFFLEASVRKNLSSISPSGSRLLSITPLSTISISPLSSITPHTQYYYPPSFTLKYSPSPHSSQAHFHISPLHTTSPPSSSSTSTSTLLKDWKLGRLNHVAIAVPDLDRASKMYRDIMGAEVSEVTPLPEHGVYTVFINLGNTKIELLHPLGENSPIKSFLKKKPDGGMHHICIEVDDIKKALKDLDGKIRALNPKPKIGAHGKPVVFLHPKDCDGVLVELEEA